MSTDHASTGHGNTGHANTGRRPLPYTDPAHQAAHQFLVEEAALLDAADYAGWLGLLCDDIRYLMPVRVTTARGAGFDTLADMGHFDEDMYALRKRVQRLATDHAWTEDPPSRTRHFVTNVRTFPGSAVPGSAVPGSAVPGSAPPNGGVEFRVESAVLLFRSRGDTREADLVSAGRTDVLRETADGLRLARREILVDEAVLRTQNLAVFL
jgi:phthalate 3,4-dioxygenase subunit beta